MSGIKKPWDEMHPGRARREAPKVEEEPELRGLEHDVKNIARHSLFGATIGGLTGVCISGIELMRDPKQMAVGQRGLATKRMFKFGGEFGLWFAGFHGTRKILQLYAPRMSPDRQEDFIYTSALAAGVSMTPLLVVPRLRAMIPYGVFLITMDAVNSYTSGG